MVSERVVCREFVGRVGELEHLRARRRAAAEGRGGLVLIAGEAGIGKSRLVREFCVRLAPGRHRIEAAACREFGQRPLRALGHLLRSPDGTSPFDERTPSRDEQLAAVLAAFDRVAERGTAVLTLDDLHWADGELLGILDVLAERAVARRVLLVGTYRDDEIVASHSLFIPFGRLLRRDGVSLLHLGPLGDDESERLLRGALSGDTELAPETLRDVLRRSGGNPLFTEELLRHVVDRERSGAVQPAHSLPLTLQAVVRERLNRCSARERSVLAPASLFGRRFRADLVADISGVSLETLIAPLQRLCELQLLDVREEIPHGFQFRHALTRDAVYGELLPAQTRPLHHRIARVLAARPDAAAFAEVIAHNFCAAGELAAAAPHCERAGDEARAVHAYEEAASWYERAARGRDGDDAAVGAVLAKSADALLRADAIDRVVAMREAAAAAFWRAGDLERAVQQRNYVTGSLANDGRTDAAREYGEATLALVPRGAVHVRAGVSIRLAAMEAAVRRPDAAWRYLEAVDENTLDRGTDVALEYYGVRSSIHAQRAEVSAWRTCFTQALAICDAIDSSAYMRRWLPGSIAVQALNLGELETARVQQARSLEQAQASRLDVDYARAVMAQIELRAGNVALASTLVEQTRPTRERLPRLERTLAGLGVAAALGEREVLEDLLDLELVETAQARGNPFAMIEAACACAKALVLLGRPREAMPLLERAVAAMRNPFGLSEAIAIVAQYAPQLAGALRPLVAAQAQAPEDRVNSALLALLDASLAVDDGAARRAHAERAAAGFEALGWPLFEARTRELGDQLEEALALYRRCGAVGEVRRLARAAYASAPVSGSVLTGREHAIAELVAAGKGNRAAAVALSLSEKSVEKSLTAIYAKLGLNSRTQLAAYMAIGKNARP
jgi:DNA-binding CsgD family transcriptional regulator